MALTIECGSYWTSFMPSPRTDLVDMLASMPELQALLMAEREAAKQEREAARLSRESSAQRIAQLEGERDTLRASHQRLWHEVELFKRRLFIAKAERADDEKQLRIEFADKLLQLGR